MITQKNHPANHPSKNPLGNLGLKGPNLENQIFYQKLGPVTLLVLPFPIIMPKIRKIPRAVFHILRGLTNGRTDYFLGCRLYYRRELERFYGPW